MARLIHHCIKRNKNDSGIGDVISRQDLHRIPETDIRQNTRSHYFNVAILSNVNETPDSSDSPEDRNSLPTYHSAVNVKSDDLPPTFEEAVLNNNTSEKLIVNPIG